MSGGGKGMGSVFLSPSLQVANEVWVALFPEPTKHWERRLVYGVAPLQGTEGECLGGDGYVAPDSFPLPFSGSSVKL